MRRLSIGLLAVGQLLAAGSGLQGQSSSPADSALAAEIARRIEAGRYPSVVIGLYDNGATRTRGFGRGAGPDSGPVDGNTVYEIGSITKTFTGVLLADMISRHLVKLDDSVQALLPAGVQVPRRGRAITLLDLTTQHSGLPRGPTNMHPADQNNPWADYSVEQLHAFLNTYQLTRAPGDSFEYSNVGVGLLGYALSLRAGKSWEELAIERIMSPLGMTDTRVTLSPEMRSRLAAGHDGTGAPAMNWDIPTLVGAGGLRSTANDMLKLIRASFDSASPLFPTITEAQRIHREIGTKGTDAIGFNWFTRRGPAAVVTWHNGGTGGYRAYIGIDKAHRRGIVLLTNSTNSPDDIARHWLDAGVPLDPPPQ